MKHNKFLIAILLFIIHCSLFTASAQSWQELMDSTNAYIEKQDYETALKWGKLALDKAKEEFGEKDTNYTFTLSKIVDIHDKLGETDTAIQAQEKNLKICRELYKEIHKELAKNINNMAVLYNKKDRYLDAEKLFKEALEMRRNLFIEDHPDLAAGIINMAFFYGGIENYSDAELLGKEGLEMYRRLYKEDNPDFASGIDIIAYIYNKISKYDEAEALLKEALEMRKRLYKSDHPDLANSINGLANFYNEKGRFFEAEPLLIEVLEMRKRLFKNDHPDLAISFDNLASYYYGRGNYVEAEPLYKEAIEMYRRLFKEDNSRLATCINNLGLFYNSRGKYAEAEPLLKEAIEMRRRLYKGDHSELALSIISMAYFFDGLGKYKEAEPLFNEGLEMNRRLFKGDHIYLAATISNVASFFYRRGRISEAELLFIECLDMKRRLFKGDHPDLANSIGNMAFVFNDRGKYSEAGELYKEALDMNRRIYKGDHPNLATSIHNVAYFLYGRGRYLEAEPLYNEAFEMRKRIYKVDHPDLANSFNNIATFQEVMGNYIEAEKFYKEALDIRRKIFKSDHPDLATSINNLANFYSDHDSFSLAEPLYKEAIDMHRRLYKEDNPRLAASINNMAMFYNVRGDYKQAAPLFEEANKMLRKLFMNDHPYLASSITNMASLLENQGNFSDAEKLFNEAYGMRKRLYKQSNPDIANSIYNIASFLNHNNRINEAIQEYKELIDVCNSLIKEYFPTLTEKEREQFFATFSKYYSIFNNFTINRIINNPNLSGHVFDNVLLTKGILLNSTKKVRDRIYNSNDTSLIRLFNIWSDKKEYISKLFKMTNQQLTKKGIDIDSVKKETNDIEKELSKCSEFFKKENERINIKWKDIQNNISKNEAVLEIVQMKLYDKRWTDTNYYVALIVKKNSKFPEMVIIKNGNELEEKYLSNYYSSITHQLEDKNSYEQYWKPISDKLKGIKKVYLSVDGVYNQINLNTLKNPKTGEYLLSEKDIVLVTSTRDLVERHTPESPFNKGEFVAELFGDPKFNLDSTKHIELAMTYKNTDKPYIERGIVDSLMTRGNLAPLPGTRKEIENIYRILKTKEWGVNSHLGEEAIEEAVKTINSPRVLHIATHGMFLKDIDKSNEDERMFGMETKRFVENPLLRSMLLFAGAENTISKKGESTTETKTDDGLLTAYEAMNLNLDNTELVVLSACETGLGEIKNGEGVYGLQRAFVQAGAKSIIMSLWKVSDEASQELMTSFYTKWLSGKPKRQAFREAQIDMMKQHPEPFYWGAFVMVGE